MLSLSKQRIIKSALRFKYSGPQRIKWWLKDQSLIPVAQSIAETIRNIATHVLCPDIRIFKLNERKAVFWAHHPRDPARSFVVKAFFLNRFEHRFKHHRYGRDEAANILTARDRGISAPELFAYGQITNRLAFVKVSIITLEYLPDLSPIRALMRTKSEDECSRLFMRTIPLFVSLYKARCKHIDINTANVMLSEHSINPGVFLLDFQHAEFFDKPSTEVLMFEAGYFARSCRNFVPVKTITEWLDKLMTAVGINGTPDAQRLEERFNYYSVARLSRKQRKKIQ